MVRDVPAPTGSDAGGLDPLASMVNEYWTPVYRMLYQLTGDSHDTEDLTQETFLRAMDRLESFQTGTNMRAWLFRIAANAYFDVHRKRKRLKIASLAEDLVGTTPQPGEWLEISEQCALLKAAMAELSETTRTVFHLRVTEDLSFRAIGEVLDTSEEAARWHMHQARTKLLQKMAKST